jgi:proteasome lid subunit RPN8/RPN11
MPETAVVTWSVPQCPFRIECSARTLDDIRLMITDAFFSLARGGLEVGGILLGRFEGSRLSVLDYAPLECEHAYGPGFTVSPADRGRLRDLILSVPVQHPGMQVVGWYHSHTRSGIFLSEEDLEVYSNFFQEPWQVSMVMKPHTFEPPRIGFFFREADGSVYAKESYQEITLEPLAMRPIPASGPPPAPPAARPMDSERERPRRRLSNVEVEVTAEAVPAEPVLPPQPVAVMPAAAVAKAPEPPPKPEPKLEPQPKPKPEPKPEPKQEPQPVVEHRVPTFATTEPKSSGRAKLVLWTLLGTGATVAVIFGAAASRELWMPKVVSAVKPPAPLPLPPPSMGLRAADHDGQLEIDWDRLSTPIRQGATARLEISDGEPSPQTISLDGAHLQAGAFTYGRQSEKVDVKLIVRTAEGKESSEVTTYVGKLPDRKPAQESEESKKQREDMAAQAAKMKADLNFQAAKTRKLEKQLNELRKQRMANQVGK